MGTCGDACAKKYDFTRQQQDDFAVASFKRAIAAQQSGAFGEEIIEVDAPAGKSTVQVKEDENPKKFNEEKLRQLRPAFGKEGTVTAGNASSINDGAAALVVITPDRAKALGVKPQARILVLTSFAEDERVFPAVMAGALGYLLKDATPQEVLKAIRDVARGEASLHPAIARRVIKELHRPQESGPTVEPLTERETQVLSLVAQGLSNQEIASKLVISERTVRTHVSNILGKLHLANRTQAARYALREGLAKLDGD
jgi:DNA-binding NarL/FixJ family response regulator